MRATVLLLIAGALSLSASGPFRKIWHFNNLRSIDGNKVTLLGHPKIVDTPHGKAVEFNGVDDAIFIGTHPLVGAREWTWEVVFRPDSGGKPEQRFFHFQEQGSD